MIMDGRKKSNIIIENIVLCLCLSVAVVALRNCTDYHCPGPIKYYEELGCTPVYENPDSCCPIRYNCDIWKNLPRNKCLVNGHVYQERERLRDEDKNACDQCSCGGSRGWFCMMSQCAGLTWMKPEDYSKVCYLINDPFQCCPDYACVEKEEDRPTCVVDGKTYKHGEAFVPSAEPEKHCYCAVGYAGKNIEPFCASPKHTWCDNILFGANLIRRNCAPTYNHDMSLETTCSMNYNFRCQNNDDVVINQKLNETNENPNMLCEFGNMKLRIGEELKEDTSWDSTCVKCVCEVPPVITCRRKPNEECNNDPS